MGLGTFCFLLGSCKREQECNIQFNFSESATGDACTQTAESLCDSLDGTLASLQNRDCTTSCMCIYFDRNGQMVVQEM